MEKYSALIIDLKKSRDYKHFDRIEIQNYIKSIINSLNSIFCNSIKFNVIFSAGDEIQGLFYSPNAAYLYFRLFNMLISPVEVRAGIGVGEWSIKIDSTNSTEQDGPAYYNARYAINNVDDSLGYSVLLHSQNDNDIYINSAINTSTLIVNNQSKYQNELFILTEMMFPINMNSSISIEKLSQINELIAQRGQMEYYSTWKLSRRYPFTVANLSSLECTPLDAIKESNTLYISSGKIKGLPNKLSKVLGTSRQNIEKSIKVGNVFQERNSTIIALKLIKRYVMEVN